MKGSPLSLLKRRLASVPTLSHRSIRVAPQSTVGRMHARIGSAFAEPVVRRWPGAVRLGVLIAGVAFSWGIIVGAAALLF